MKKLVTLISRILFLDYRFIIKRDTLTVFMFHKINNNKDVFYQGMPSETFEKLCYYIKKKYTVISLNELKNKDLTNNQKPHAVITFDDGHKEILDIAYPILKRLNLSFNINIDTEILETGEPQDFVKVYDILNKTKCPIKIKLPSFDKIDLTDKTPLEIENLFTSLLSEMTRDLRTVFISELIEFTKFKRVDFSSMLSTEDVSYLYKNGVEIGSHSHTHAILPNLSKKEIEYELSHSKEMLKDITKSNISILAFPNGKTNDEIEFISKKLGYTIFLETEDKSNKLYSIKSEDVFRLKRINQYHQTLNEALFHTYSIKKRLRFWQN